MSIALIVFLFFYQIYSWQYPFYYPQTIYESYLPSKSRSNISVSFSRSLEIGIEFISNKISIPKDNLVLSSGYQDDFEVVHLVATEIIEQLEVT
jgi:hypothetical protein